MRSSLLVLFFVAIVNASVLAVEPGDSAAEETASAEQALGIDIDDLQEVTDESLIQLIDEHGPQSIMEESAEASIAAGKCNCKVCNWPSECLIPGAKGCRYAKNVNCNWCCD